MYDFFFINISGKKPDMVQPYNSSMVYAAKIKFHKNGESTKEVIFLSYVDPKLRRHFESLSIDLKNEILKRNVSLSTLDDLIQCLEEIANEPPHCGYTNSGDKNEI